MVVDGVWSTAEARAYMDVFCLKKSTQEYVLTNASNAKVYKEAFLQKDESEINMEIFKEIKEERDLNKGSFEIWKFPAKWCRGLQLDMHIETIMHLIFLGVVKSTVIRINSWLKTRGQFTVFVSKTRGRLDSVKKVKSNLVCYLHY